MSSNLDDARAKILPQKNLEHSSFFSDCSSILVPKKSENILKKYVSRELLEKIDPNHKVAVEKCLVILSNLASTFYTEDCWKSLNSQILHMQVKSGRNNTFVYQYVIDVLKSTTTMSNPIIEIMLDSEGNELFRAGKYSRKFKIADEYRTGLVEYKLTDKKIISNLRDCRERMISEALMNPVCANLINIYPKISLPSAIDLISKARNLVKNRYHTRKGKRLTMRNKHKDHYWKDFKNRSFVEDNIKLFKALTSKGYLIPTIGGDKSGGRVVDSFTLMPKWIRDEITIDDDKLIECDYTALHPNIAIKLYEGKQSYITHEIVAKNCSIEEVKAKREHLSFFNKKICHMKSSPVFKYYNQKETEMIENIFHDKKSNNYKVTSVKMFKVEVAIMTDVIKYLNSVGIYVIYVYDALLCKPKDLEIVTETMNRIVLQHGVKTIVKNNLDVDISKDIEETRSSIPIIKEYLKDYGRYDIIRVDMISTLPNLCDNCVKYLDAIPLVNSTVQNIISIVEKFELLMNRKH